MFLLILTLITFPKALEIDAPLFQKFQMLKKRQRSTSTPACKVILVHNDAQNRAHCVEKYESICAREVVSCETNFDEGVVYIEGGTGSQCSHLVTVNLTATSVDALSAAAEAEDVVWMEEDKAASRAATLVQNPTTWGLAKIADYASPTLPRNYDTSYSYPYEERDGAGVQVFVLDTGFAEEWRNAAEFAGRVHPLKSFYGSQGDKDGHGTHVAGTVGGKTYGVAKAVELYPVKVLDDLAGGVGSNFRVVQGLEYAQQQCNGKCVAVLSLESSASSFLDTAVTKTIEAGIVGIVAAGNGGRNACEISPARAQLAITVGSVDRMLNARHNWGRCVDVFAPGVWILSTTTGGRTAVMSGTSMAAPHVAGLVAVMMSRARIELTRAMVMARLINTWGVQGAVRNIVGNSRNLFIQKPMHTTVEQTPAACGVNIPLGNSVALTSLKINEQCSTQITKTGSGLTVELSYENHETLCPGCKEQIYIGFRETRLVCIYNDNPDETVRGAHREVFEAMPPGTYSLVGAAMWDSSCRENLHEEAGALVELGTVTLVPSQHGMEGTSHPATSDWCAHGIDIGNSVVVDRFQINKQCTNELTVAVGASVELVVDFNNGETGCTGCKEQIYIGLQGSSLTCIFDDNPNEDQTLTHTLPLSSLPIGRHTVVAAAKYDWSCRQRVSDGAEIVTVIVVSRLL